MSEVILWMAITVIYISVIEYSLHRWAMHFPLFGRKWPYRDHAVEHHGRGRNDLNIDISPLTVMLLGSPLLVGCLWLGWFWAVTLLAICFGYALAWTALHRAHHDVGCLWIKRLPFYRIWRQHHEQHHERPNRNFGTICIWSDVVFRTLQWGRDFSVRSDGPLAKRIGDDQHGWIQTTIQDYTATMKLPRQVKFIPPQEFPLADAGRPPQPKTVQYRTREAAAMANPESTPEEIGNDTTGWTEFEYDQFYGARRLWFAKKAEEAEAETET